MPTDLWNKKIIPEGLKYTHKDKFDLFVGDNCDACNGMEKKAEEFAYKHNMIWKKYHNSKEVKHIPTIKFCEFQIVGNKAFEKLLFIVRAKRSGFL